MISNIKDKFYKCATGYYGEFCEECINGYYLGENKKCTVIQGCALSDM